MPAFSFAIAGASAPIGAHPSVVLFSLLIAALASYVALDLAVRVRSVTDAVSSRLWIVAGSVVLGTGIWSMHFIGMAAADFPFPPRVDNRVTLFSWIVAIAAASLPVALASSRAARKAVWGWVGAVATSLGVAAMHLIGMSAMETAPGPVLDVGYLLVAAALATVCTRFALVVSGGSSERRGLQAFLTQAKAAALLAGGLTCLHYVAMAAAAYADGSVCTTTQGLDIDSLGSAVGFVSLAFLTLMMLVSWLERRSHRLALQLNRSLDQAQADLQYVTFNDAVTGLPNRLVFQDRLSQAVDMQARIGGALAVLLVELDHFDEQTRHLDDAQSEALVREAAARLVAVVGKSCAVSYAGNQQFLLLTSGPGVDADAAVAVVERVEEALRMPCGDGAGALLLRVSTGITLFPNDGAAERLTANAAVALESARQQHGSTFAFFEAGMDSDAHERAVWLATLRLAVQRNQLELHYQPKVHASSARVTGVEALLRWRHPERGLISPAIFVPLAERFGLMNEIGAWVTEQACRQMAAWCADGIRMRVAINVSVTQIGQPDFAGQVTRALARHGVDPALLTCELTESGAMRDVEQTRQVFDDLQRAGVQMSIDDFGTGYSSLSYLRRLPIRQLKIDRSFVSDLERDPDARAVVASIIQLAHALRLEVVAEGVETQGQCDILLGLRCDKFQGFLFARPMPVAELTRLLLATETVERFRDSIFAAV